MDMVGSFQVGGVSQQIPRIFHHHVACFDGLPTNLLPTLVCRPRADVAASPAAASAALDSGPVKVSCLQLGLSLNFGLKLSKTLSSIARALRFQPGRCFFRAGCCSTQSAAAGVQDAQQAPCATPTDACGAAVTASKSARAGGGLQKVTAVQIDVIGYPLGAADALTMQVPA